MRIGRLLLAASLTAGAICCGVDSIRASSTSPDAGLPTGAGDASLAAPSADAGSVAPPDAGVDPPVAAPAPADAAPPLGALPVDGGWSFRVWAPNASQVTVEGDFGSQALAPVDGGIFAGVVAGAVSGQHYGYVVVNGGESLARTDPRAPLLGADPGQQEPPGILYDSTSFTWQSGAFTPPPRDHAVIYELHLGTFVDPNGTGAGTYASAATKLADLAQLGINMVELLPVTEFPGSYSWGYNPIYPFAPCRAYGSPDDLKSFVDQAHQLGIGVILDVVFNHFGLDSQETPSLSMWCFDGPCDGGGIYFAPEPATPWGPRPAFGSGEVHDLILDSLATWMSSYRADGFRWDSVVAIRNQSLDGMGTEILEGARLLRDANVAIHARAPGAITIAEDLQGWSAITAPVDPSTIEQYGSGYGFDTQWDDNFFYTLTPLLIATSDDNRDVTQLVGPLTAGPPMQRVVYTEDHDKVSPQNGPQNQRIPELIGVTDNGYWAERRAGLGLAIVLTAPATPMLFMGQEFLETLPFPFTPGPAIEWNNEQTYAGFRMMVHDLIALRKNTAAQTDGLTGGNIKVIQAANTHGGTVSPAIGYHRWKSGGPGDDVVVAANFSNTQLNLTIGLPQPGTWHVRFNSDSAIYSQAFGGTPSNDVQASGAAQDGEAQSGTVALGSYSVVILGQ